MKTIIPFLLFVFLFSAKCFAQSKWYGVWDVNCSVGGLDERKPTYCRLCPVSGSMETKDWRISGFIFDIKKDSLEIRMPSRHEHETVPYTWDNKKSNISFSFQKEKYTFHAEAGKMDTVTTDEGGKGEHRIATRDTTFTDEHGYILNLQKRKVNLNYGK